MHSSPASPTIRKVMIVDDEAPARARLERLLSRHSSLEIIGTAGGISEAAAKFAALRPDLLFLDIEMPDGTGFDLLPFLDPVPRIIFVTAHEGFAVKAFEVNAVDYLLKPVFESRLDLTLRRILGEIPESEASAQTFQMEDLLFLRTPQASVAVEAKDILYISAERNFSHVHATKNRKIMIYRTLAQWQQRLPEEHFPRIDRSLLLNLSRLQKVEPLDPNHTLLHLRGLAEPLMIGRTALRRLNPLIRRL